MKPNLVVTCVGNNSRHLEWIKDSPNFDLAIIYYQSGREDEYAASSQYMFTGTGFFWKLIESFLTTNWDIISKYEYVWFPDDDVSITTESINRMFVTMKEYGLWIAQPALSTLGYPTHPHLHVDPSCKLRYTSFVEIMAPAFDINTLERIRHTISDTDSGWGLEYLWFDILDQPKDKIAIIDEITMIHTKAHSGYPPGVNPSADWQRLIDRFHFTHHPIQIFDKIPL